MNDEDEQRLWILYQDVRNEYREFERLLSNVHIMLNIYKIKSAGDEDIEDKKLKKRMTEMIKEIDDFRRFKKERTPQNICDLKINIDNLLAEIISKINPKNMFTIDIHEGNV
jgi:hypothetical protein